MIRKASGDQLAAVCLLWQTHVEDAMNGGVLAGNIGMHVHVHTGWNPVLNLDHIDATRCSRVRCWSRDTVELKSGCFPPYKPQPD